MVGFEPQHDLIVMSDGVEACVPPCEIRDHVCSRGLASIRQERCTRRTERIVVVIAGHGAIMQNVVPREHIARHAGARQAIGSSVAIGYVESWHERLPRFYGTYVLADGQ